MKVGLFIPCYINAVYPEVGVASYKLLKSLGVDVDYPLDQTCCGQPMANAGFEGEAKELAKRLYRRPFGELCGVRARPLWEPAGGRAAPVCQRREDL